ncbi:hypothetical protein [Paenibacillus hamazuiensis]|uniref:hypothetical protein n=1 Tax=Paenibacillus hamazuiensis TaxID=2936508 RepID=UPI00200CB270|nr:hypothetical protein [Paenibacillus hamazuiensis]
MTNYMPLDEGAFDLNDWFILGCIAAAYTIVFLLPKRFPSSVTFLLFMFSSTVACIMDNSIGGHIFDLYDIMDGPAYTIMDFVAYLLYGPAAYFFIYFYDRLQLKGLKTVGYIVLWSFSALGFEWLCHWAGVFRYKDSYSYWYSFCIYLFSQSATVRFYRFIAEEPHGHRALP